MKVLFVASNPADASTLKLEREITELQRRFVEAAGEPVAFVFLPDLQVEDLPAMIARHRPDVLHISAHGADGHLSLANEARTSVRLDAETLATFLMHERPPRLIYLSACDSVPVAQQLSRTVPMVIGITAPVTNRAARAAAITFYERILEGAPVGKAFAVSQRMIGVMDAGTVSASLFPRPGVDPSREVLHRVPRLVADFDGADPKEGRDHHNVRLGLTGCPSNTTQVVFFTDDGSYADDEATYEEDLCLVVRGSPVRGTIWTGANTWEASGDFRLFAVGVTGGGTTFSVGSTLCEAIETRYFAQGDGTMPSAVSRVVAQLRRNDGSDIEVAGALRESRGGRSSDLTEKAAR